MLLAGDIGGTKTNLAVFSRADGARSPLAQRTFPSPQYPSLEALALEFLGAVELPVERAAFGVAGPVIDGKAKLTNLPWMLDEAELAHSLRLSSVRLLNDLQAIAHGIPQLQSEDLHTLSEGQRAPHGNLAVIAPGTGLGQAFLTWDGQRYRVHASEGGHVDFAPVDEVQSQLLRYLQDRFEHVSCERVCSGHGIPNIYDFLRDHGYADEPAWLADQLAVAPDRTPIIFNQASKAGTDSELCAATVSTFVSIFGAVAGNFGLHVAATGGVYLGGGIPPRILAALQDGAFMRAFANKGRSAGLLRDMPVHVVLYPDVALFGAACHGFETTDD